MSEISPGLSSRQADDFYKKHGYPVVGILPDIPDGNQKYLLMKKL